MQSIAQDRITFKRHEFAFMDIPGDVLVVMAWQLAAVSIG